MKLLFVTIDNYPYSGACTTLLNNMFFDGGFANDRNKISVLTIKTYLNQKSIEKYNEITIYRTLSNVLIDSEEIKNNIIKTPIKALTCLLGKIKYRSLKKIHNNMYYNKILTDEIYKGLKKYKLDDYDYIIPVISNIHLAVAVEQYVKENLKSKVALYQVDPFSTNYVLQKYSKTELMNIEKNIYENADIIFTTPIILEENKLKYSSAIMKKMVAMEFPSFVDMTYKFKNRNIKKESEPIKCVFSGSIYSNIRNPEYTLKLFSKLEKDNVQLVLIGVTSDELFKGHLNKNIVCLGKMNIEETREYLIKADFLVNIGNIMTNQIPSKIFEYMSMSKPIINICKSTRCPSIQYIDKYQSGINIIETSELEKNYKLVRKFIVDNKNVIIDKEKTRNTFFRCTAKYCSKLMSNTLDERKNDGK